MVARLAAALRVRERAAPAGMAEAQAALPPDTRHEIELDAGLFFNLHTRRVRQIDGADVALTRSEAALLALLAARPEAAVTREVIAAEILGRAWSYSDRSVDNAVSSLRRKLGFDRDFGPIRTVRNQGYRLVLRRAR